MGVAVSDRITDLTILEVLEQRGSLAKKILLKAKLHS